MPNLRDIQRRIRSVKKTQQITSAMRMVAAAKLRRAQDSIITARPYSDRMYQTLGEIVRRQREIEHPLLEERDPKRCVEAVVVTSDRGLCGAFNHNLVRFADRLLTELQAKHGSVVVSPIGRKADEYFRKRRKEQLGRSWTGLGTVRVEQATEIANYLAERFEAGEIDEAIIVGNEFVSALTQRPVEVGLLPSPSIRRSGEEAATVPGASDSGDGAAEIPFEVEPHAEKLLGVLVPKVLEFTIFRVLLENQAGEHAARMASMESATRNTEDLIQSLTLQFNRARQAAITKELVEIVTGAQALE